MSINYKYELPSLQCSEDQCLADFQLQKGIQKSSMCMFSRISKRHANSNGMHAKMGHQEANFKGKGLLGTVVAFSAADEEQGRKTLHSH